MRIQHSSHCPMLSHWHLEEASRNELPMTMSCADYVEFKVLGPEGNPLGDVDVLVYGHATPVETTDIEGCARINIFDRDGVNTATIVEEPADQVTGLDLCADRTVVYRLIFRWIR